MPKKTNPIIDPALWQIILYPSHKPTIFPKVKKLVPDIKGKKIAIWGLSFKPNTDDIREAPALILIKQLQKAGAIVAATDPAAIENMKNKVKDVAFSEDSYEVLEDASCLVLMTEWDEFRNFSKTKVKGLMKEPNIVDARNVWYPEDLTEAGFNYLSVGR